MVLRGHPDRGKGVPQGSGRGRRFGFRLSQVSRRGPD